MREPTVPTLALALAVALAGASPAEEASPLAPGKAVDDRIDLDSGTSRKFLVEAPADAIALFVVLEKAPVELSLVASHGAPVDEAEEGEIHEASPEWGTSELFLSRLSVPELQTGTYHVDVVYRGEERPRVGERELARIPFTIRVDSVTGKVDGRLEPGAPVTSRTDRESGFARTFELAVPKGLAVFRADLDGAWRDLDLVARRASPVRNYDDAEFFAESSLMRESLVVPGDGSPVRAGLWYITVFDRAGAGSTPFTIHATLGEAPPADLLEIPVLAEPTDPLERALLATVEILGPTGAGSGTILTPGGLILTNHHVVATTGAGVQADGDLVVAISTDPRVPARDLFRARVIESDPGIDLALLEIASGLYGQPLPSGYRFPAIPLGDPDGAKIASPVVVIGYPVTGGTTGRVSETLTRGVISGFEAIDAGVLFKTDADISSGNSGGAALDAEYRLFGVPTSVVPEEGGNAQMGYIHPISLLPASWRQRIEAHR